MTIMSDSRYGLDSNTIIDARHTDGPVTLVRIEAAIKTAQTGTVFAILTRDAEAEINIRSFCRKTKNEYIGSEHELGHNVHWIKKTNAQMQCETCSGVRTVASGVATVALLLYTAPDVLAGGESTITTILFILAICALPPVAYNNYHFGKRVIRRLLEERDVDA